MYLWLIAKVNLIGLVISLCQKRYLGKYIMEKKFILKLIVQLTIKYIFKLCFFHKLFLNTALIEMTISFKHSWLDKGWQ